MSKAQVVVSKKRALIEAPVPAAPEKPDVPATAVALDADAERVARIRKAAYGLYEARGKSDGHEVEDWLAAEAALAGDPIQP